MSKYWSPEDVLSTGATYNFILGGRSCGKTYGLIRMCIENWFKTGGPKNGEQFAYIRRYKESIGPSKVRTLIEPHYGLIEELSGGKYNAVQVYRQAFWLICQVNGKIIRKCDHPLGVLVSLSTQDVDKGQDLGFVRYILFDEAIARDRYLNDEWAKFTNCVSSLVRDRAGSKIFFIANPISKFCYLFDELGIDFNSAKQGTITIISYPGTDMKTSFEYIAETQNVDKMKNEYFAFENSKVASITSGIWELEQVQHLDSGIYKISQQIYEFFLEYGHKIFRGEIMMYNNVAYIYWTPASKIKEKSYYLSLEAKLDPYCIVDFAPNNLTAAIQKINQTGQIYYATNTVGDFIHGFWNAIQESKGKK